MIEIDRIDHVGIRISDRQRSVAFYELLGFRLLADGGYENGHPLVMLHPSGININLLGPAAGKAGENVLMDEPVKYPGITHIALKMKSAEETEAFMVANGIEITGPARIPRNKDHLCARSRPDGAGVGWTWSLGSGAD